MALPPLTLPINEAARFVGCKNPKQFQREVDEGIWPKPLPIKSRPKRWSVEALKQRVAEMTGIATNAYDSDDPLLDQRLREF